MNWKLVKAALVLFGIGGSVVGAAFVGGSAVAEVLWRMLEVLR